MLKSDITAKSFLNDLLANAKVIDGLPFDAAMIGEHNAVFLRGGELTEIRFRKDNHSPAVIFYDKDGNGYCISDPDAEIKITTS